MSLAGVIYYACFFLALAAIPGALVRGYSRARAEKPPFPVNRLTVVWAALNALTLLLVAPAIAAGPAAGDRTCAARGPLYPDCVVWSVLSVIWPLLIPSALYFLIHATVVFAPRRLRARFDRMDRWLERERRKSGGGP